MITVFKLMFLALIFTLFSCEARRLETESVVEKANTFAASVDSVQLSDFQHWHFHPRGFWQNDSVDTAWYTLSYRLQGDSSEIMVGNPERFIQDFHLDVLYDTSMHSIRMVKEGNIIRLYTNRDGFVKQVGTGSLAEQRSLQFHL